MARDADLTRADPGRAPAHAELTRAHDEHVEQIARAREGRRSRYRPERRELVCELLLAIGFVVCALAMQLTLPAREALDPVACGLLVAVLIACLQVDFEVGEGRTSPLQLAIVPMLFVLPARSVPLLVAGTFVVAGLVPALRSGRGALRTVLVVSDCWFVIGPALVFAVAAPAHPGLAAAWLLALALPAQLGLDCTVSFLRLWLGMGIDPRTHARAFALTYLVDALLTPVGLLTAIAARQTSWAALLVLPMGALLAIFATERRRRIDTALELHRVVGESEARLQSILQHSSDLIAITDADGTVRTATGAARAMLGSGIELGSLHLLDRVHPTDQSLVRAFLRDTCGRDASESPAVTFTLRFADDSWHHVDATASNLLADERVRGLVLTIRDANERKALEDQLRHRAFHDALTGLPNRALFYDRIEHALHLERREDEQCAVLFIDLDDFKQINDRFGHDAGDQVLVTAAARLRGCVSSADTAARLGGDEFGLLLEGVSGVSACVAAAEAILRAFEPPIAVGTEAVRLRPSVGIAIREPGSADADELLRQADLAMYSAKHQPEASFALFERELDAIAGDDLAPRERRGSWFTGAREQRRSIEQLLDRPDAVRAVFQPIVDLRTGAIAGYEALSRFTTTVARPPNFWFAQAHRCGLGYQLEARALEVALRVPDRPAHTYLSLNLSPSALASAEAQAVLPTDLHGITIEVTENELVAQNSAIAETIAEYRSRGARLAVDDAGSGYAGLTHLMALAPDVIKLDRALIDGIATDPAKVALVGAFVGYAERIGASVCAEGIESLDDLERLADLDVSHGQGYALARPSEPWTGIDPEATVRCRDGLQRLLGRAPGAAVPISVDGECSARLNRVESTADLVAVQADLARALHCDHVTLVSGDDQGVGDRVQDTDTHSTLIVSVSCRGRTLGWLHAARPKSRPWSRRDAGQALVLANHLGDVLERLGPADTPRLLPDRGAYGLVA